jgi:hypothetical protein
MERRRPVWLPIAILSAAAVAGTAACGSSPSGEDLGRTDQPLLLQLPACDPGYARVCAPTLFGACPCEPEITTEARPVSAYPPADAPTDQCVPTLLSGPIAVPPELEGNGCTLGVVYGANQARLWACPGNVPAPKTIAWPEAPLGSEVYADAWYSYTWSSNCIGPPSFDPLWTGWEYIVQVANGGNQGCKGGCPWPAGGPGGGGPLHPALGGTAP